MSSVDRSCANLPLSLKGENEAKEAKSSTNLSANAIIHRLANLAVEKQMKEEIQFLRSQNYCVCFVRMVNSTGVISTVNDSDDIRRHYTIFINTMSIIARSFGAKIVKNITDGLIMYFPQTSNSIDDSAFKDVIECGITMLAAGNVINAKLTKENLAAVTYRISADYGKVEVAKLKTSQHEDLFGPTMNLCAKINSNAPANVMVIGGDLFLVLKSLSSSPSFKQTDYRFKEVKGHSITGFTHEYPAYSVTSKYSRTYPDLEAILSTLNDKQAHESELKEVPQHPSFSTSPTSYSSYNIMLVDDEKDVLYSFNAALINNGYHVQAFSDSQEALECFAQGSHFDLVILDLRMPGLNGLELYTKLKAINSDVKILFLSALDVVPELVSILPDVKQDDILRKPVATEDFINAVKKKRQKS
jgi:two-component system response regulator ChvI